MQVLDGNRISTFLDSIGRNSRNSKRMYSTGLVHFSEFLALIYGKQTPDTIIPLLVKGKVNVYELLDQFVSYLTKQQSVSISSLKSYVAAVKSFLEYYDIDIVPSKFRRRVKIPKFFQEPEEPLTLADIRELLNHCNNQRLRCYMLVMLSSALRPIECASLRFQDVDFNTHPTRITVRKEYSKTKRSRQVYMSDEATNHLQKLLKYRRKSQLQPDSLIFAIQKRSKVPDTIYYKMRHQFQKLLTIAGKDQHKENSRRHKFTLHSFRRTAFSIINEQTNSEFANYYLGHTNSPYWIHKESERRHIYATRCMPNLTVLDYSSLDAQQKNIQAELQVKDKQIHELTRRLDEQAHRLDMQEAWLRNPEQFIEMRNEAIRLGQKKK